MTATHTPFERVQGDTWRFDLELHDDGGGPLNLTGAQVEWLFYDADGSLQFTLDTSNGVTISATPTDGLATVVVDKTRTAALATGTYYDITRATLADDTVTTQAMGLINVVDRPSIPVTPTGSIDWTLIDFTDPCGTLALLEPKYYSVLVGGGIIKAKYGDQEITYSQSNFATFDNLIRQLREACARFQGIPQRYAMRIGSRGPEVPQVYKGPFWQSGDE